MQEIYLLYVTGKNNNREELTAEEINEREEAIYKEWEKVRVDVKDFRKLHIVNIPFYSDKIENALTEPHKFMGIFIEGTVEEIVKLRDCVIASGEWNKVPIVAYSTDQSIGSYIPSNRQGRLEPIVYHGYNINITDVIEKGLSLCALHNLYWNLHIVTVHKIGGIFERDAEKNYNTSYGVPMTFLNAADFYNWLCDDLKILIKEEDIVGPWNGTEEEYDTWILKRMICNTPDLRFDVCINGINGKYRRIYDVSGVTL